MGSLYYKSGQLTFKLEAQRVTPNRLGFVSFLILFVMNLES